MKKKQVFDFNMHSWHSPFVEVLEQWQEEYGSVVYQTMDALDNGQQLIIQNNEVTYMSDMNDHEHKIAYPALLLIQQPMRLSRIPRLSHPTVSRKVEQKKC